MRRSGALRPWMATGSKEDAVYGMAWIQRAVGVLEHHLHQLEEGLVPLGPERLAVDGDAPTPMGIEPAKRAQHRGLARAGLADQSEVLALGDPERDLAHRVDRIAAAAENGVQPVDLDPRLAQAGPGAGQAVD